MVRRRRLPWWVPYAVRGGGGRCAVGRRSVAWCAAPVGGVGGPGGRGDVLLGTPLIRFISLAARRPYSRPACGLRWRSLVEALSCAPRETREVEQSSTRDVRYCEHDSGFRPSGEGKGAIPHRQPLARGAAKRQG